MNINDQTLKTLNKHGDVLLTNQKKIITLLKCGLHMVLDVENDFLTLKSLINDSNGIQFAKTNFCKSQFIMPCEDNKDLLEILNSIEK